MKRSIFQTGDTVPFYFPRNYGESATTAALKIWPSVDIQTTAVREAGILQSDHIKALIQDDPNDDPEGTFAGEFDTTGREPGEYYILLPVTRKNDAGADVVTNRRLVFWLGGGF